MADSVPLLVLFQFMPFLNDPWPTTEKGNGIELRHFFPIWDSSNRKSLLTNGLAVIVSGPYHSLTASLTKFCFLHFFFQKYYPPKNLLIPDCYLSVCFLDIQPVSIIHLSPAHWCAFWLELAHKS